jgi:Spy/CpxP family protein refolding chaperone
MSRPVTIALSFALTAWLAGVAFAQGSAHHGPHGAPGGTPHHALALTCDGAFEENVRDGRGFGMAFVADQQGYPGPLHVLELKDRLRLSRDQEAKAQALLAAMFAESRPKSARLLNAEARLRQLFAAGPPDEAAVRTAVAEVETARADVRLVHLLFHLKMRDALTDEQRRVYQEARWGGPSTPTR